MPSSPCIDAVWAPAIIAGGFIALVSRSGKAASIVPALRGCGARIGLAVGVDTQTLPGAAPAGRGVDELVDAAICKTKAALERLPYARYALASVGFYALRPDSRGPTPGREVVVLHDRISDRFGLGLADAMAPYDLLRVSAGRAESLQTTDVSRRRRLILWDETASGWKCIPTERHAGRSTELLKRDAGVPIFPDFSPRLHVWRKFAIARAAEDLAAQLMAGEALRHAVPGGSVTL
ncbi:hypothetical protein BH09PSE2_BH09PSE2_09330 [soil metagenome]